MHRFWIFTCEIVHQFNENLGPNLLKGRGTKELEQLKNWVWKTRSDVKKCCHYWEKKVEQYVGKWNIPIRGLYLQKLPLISTSQMNQSFHMMFQLQKKNCWRFPIHNKNDKQKIQIMANKFWHNALSWN